LSASVAVADSSSSELPHKPDTEVVDEAVVVEGVGVVAVVVFATEIFVSTEIAELVFSCLNLDEVEFVN
jgi:hypothetical protein